MSKSKPDSTDDEVKTTVTTPKGETVAVRARSSHSHKNHKPVTDDEGNLVYYAPTSEDEPGRVKIVDEGQGEPRPACGLPTGNVDKIEFKTVSRKAASWHGDCKFCTDNVDVDENRGRGRLTPARRLIHGEDWGTKTK